ncbi:MAG: DUF1491 family protein [Pseudomonadota bacterium]
MDERLPTWVWIDALLRRVSADGASAFVRQRGDAERGDVVIKVADLAGGGRIYVPRTDLEGNRVFVDLIGQGVGPEEVDAEIYVDRAMQRDRDVWVVEIEDRNGRHFLTEPVEKTS